VTKIETAQHRRCRSAGKVFRKSNTITVNKSTPTYAAWPVYGGQTKAHVTAFEWLITGTFKTLAVQAPNKR